MALNNPVSAYRAETNMEARLVGDILRDAGIEAEVVEDVSVAGLFQGDSPALLAKPQVLVETDDLDKAKPIIAEYEQERTERRKIVPADGPIEVLCEDCGTKSMFPPEQNGTVQTCPACNAYLDVGLLVDIEGWDEVPPEDE